MKRWTLHVEFDAEDEWTPLGLACWMRCPLACLTKLSDVCRAREAFEKDGTIICPMYKYGQSERLN